MKKLLTVLMVTMVVLGLCTFAVSAEQLVDVTINGVEVDFDVPAQVINDRTLVPLRGIFEVLGAEVNWDNDTETVTAYRGDTSISLQIGSTSLFVNKVEKVIDVPAQLVNDRTLIPARAIAESLGATVDWDDPNQTVIITDPSAPDFKALLDKAMAEEITFNSLEVDMGIDFAMTAEDESVSANIDMSLDIIDEPAALEMDVVVDVMGEKTTAKVYMVEENGKYYAYAVAESADEKVITKQEMEKPVFSEDSEPITGYEDYVKVAAQEKVGDKDTVKFVATATGKQINDAIAKADTEGVFAAAGLADLFAADSELDLYFWVDKANNQLYKVNVDLVDTIKGMLESMGLVEGVTVDACALDLELTGIDTVKSITVPAEVKKNAIETTSME